MRTKTKLPGLLKALLALHGVCALAASFFAVWRLTYGDDWSLPYSRYVPWWNWSYFGLNLTHILSLLLPALFIFFLVSYRQRKNRACVLLAATAFLELGALAGYLLLFPYPLVMDYRGSAFIYMLKYDTGYYLLFITLPAVLFIGTLILTCLNLKPLKAFLENAK